MKNSLYCLISILSKNNCLYRPYCYKDCVFYNKSFFVSNHVCLLDACFRLTFMSDLIKAAFKNNSQHKVYDLVHKSCCPSNCSNCAELYPDSIVKYCQYNKWIKQDMNFRNEYF